MPDTLRDGKGRGWLAAVNSEQQLITRATAVEQRLVSATDANYYEASSDQITLTDAVETGIIYLKNENAGKVIVIDRVFFDFWTSTGGSGADGTSAIRTDEKVELGVPCEMEVARSRELVGDFSGCVCS